jgi:hypothetical protein
MLEVVRSVRRFAAAYAYNLPGQMFIERSSAAREVHSPPFVTGHFPSIVRMSHLASEHKAGPSE